MLFLQNVKKTVTACFLRFHDSLPLFHVPLFSVPYLSFASLIPILLSFSYIPDSVSSWGPFLEGRLAQSVWRVQRGQLSSHRFSCFSHICPPHFPGNACWGILHLLLPALLQCFPQIPPHSCQLHSGTGSVGTLALSTCILALVKKSCHLVLSQTWSMCFSFAIYILCLCQNSGRSKTVLLTSQPSSQNSCTNWFYRTLHLCSV